MDSFPSGSGSGNTASGQQPPALVAEPTDSQCPSDQPVAVPDKASRTAIKLIAHEAPVARDRGQGGGEPLRPQAAASLPAPGHRVDRAVPKHGAASVAASDLCCPDRRAPFASASHSSGTFRARSCPAPAPRVEMPPKSARPEPASFDVTGCSGDPSRHALEHPTETAVALLALIDGHTPAQVAFSPLLIESMKELQNFCADV